LLLYLKNNHLLDTNGLLLLLHTDIKHLDISWNPQIGDDAVLEVAKSCPNLERFDMKWNHTITLDPFIELTRQCSLLKSIDLSHCKQVTADWIVQIICNCEHLQQLHLAGCTSMKAQELFPALTQAFCAEKLEVLNLSGIRVWNDHFTYSVIDTFKKLLELNLSDSAITDDSIIYIAHYCAALEKTGCRILYLNRYLCRIHFDKTETAQIFECIIFSDYP